MEDEFERVLREEEEWENSPDGIRYCTHIFSTVCSKDLDEEACIVLVLSRIPTEIREFIQANVCFVIANASFPMVTPTGQCILIVITSTEADSMAAYCTTVAHEIAHVWLGRTEDGGVDGTKLLIEGLEGEIAADDLCEAWGFGRAYESYEQFRLCDQKKSP